jgi:hypothetical protein
MAETQIAQQVVAHQPAISDSISFQDLFNRAGGRTLNVGQELKIPIHAMSDPLQPFKTFLGKTWLCVILAVLPITILEGMWSDPEWRELARRFDGSTTMWISFSLYFLIICVLWCRWISRSKSPKSTAE